MDMRLKNSRQKEWGTQWQYYQHSGVDRWGNEQQHFLRHVIKPYSREMFKDQIVLDAGCGSGDKLVFLSPIVKKIIGIDLNTSDTVQKLIQTKKFPNVEFIEGDIATIGIHDKVDHIICDGVIHHTDDPEKTFKNLLKMLRPGGIMMIMVYSFEGNWFNRVVFNYISQNIFQKLSHQTKTHLAFLFSKILRGYGKLICHFKQRRFPFYEYLCCYFLNMSHVMNVLDIYDQINAPLVHYISEQQIRSWFADFYDVNVYHEKAVTWVANGRKY